MGTVIAISRLKMLVIVLLLLNVADFCQSKAFPEKGEKARGKRYYDDQNSGYRQTYEPQINAEHWMTGDFYQPYIDGQPIYVPPVEQSGSYNEFLDGYYKAYTPAWNLENPISPTYTSESIYRKPETSTDVNVASDQKHINYALPSSKESQLTIDMNPSEYDAPEPKDYGLEVDKSILTEFSHEDSSTMSPELMDLDEFEELILRETLKKKAEPPETKPADYNQYDKPVIVKTVKQKQKTNNVNDYKTKRPSIPQTEPQSENPEEYEEQIVYSKVKVKPTIKTTQPSKYDRTSQATRKKSKGKRRKQYSKSKSKIGEQAGSDENVSELKTADKISEEMSKKDMGQSVERYPSYDKSFKEKVSGKTKEKVVDKGDSEYESVQVVGKVTEKPHSINKPVQMYENSGETNPKDKPIAVYPQYESMKTDEKVVESNTGYESVKMTDNLTAKPKDKPIKAYPQYEPIKNERVVNSNTEYKSVITAKPNPEDKLVDKTNTKSKPVKAYSQYEPVKTDEKFTAKPNSEDKPKTNQKGKPMEVYPEYEPVKTDEFTSKPNSKDEHVKANPQYESGKTDGKVVIKTDMEYKSVKTEKLTAKPNSENKPAKTNEDVSVKYSIGKQTVKRKQLNDQNNDDSTESDIDDGKDFFKESDFTDTSVIESEFSEKLNSDEPILAENAAASENTKTSVESSLNSPNDFRALPSINSNIWSMLFNPNAQQNTLKQKRCITRSNETGFCTYIQNCDVPQIATSLEQLLNNACVIDEIFIGVCCPEFPVETVKVHWDQTLSDFDDQIEDEFGHNSEDCGIRSNETLEQKSWPWKAPLVSMSNGKIFCGGVLVSEDHVLTAAHCTTKIPKNQILVRLGQFDQSSGDDYAVVEIKRHAQYNPRTMHNDIALLKLGRRIMKDAHISPVCLPEADRINDHNGEIATLLGWRGIFGTKSTDPEFLEVISNKECEKRQGMKVPDALLCTETRKESERTCNADSGAPLVIEDNGKYEVIGILAWNRNDCNQRFPSTFSRVSSYTGWIKNHLE